MLSIIALCLLQTPSDPLAKLADRIDQVKSIAFDYRRDLNYDSNGFKHSLTVRMYIEFDKTWQPIGARYQAKSPTYSEIFDGVAYMCRSDTHEPISMIGPDASYFASVSVLKNSLFGLGKALRAAQSHARGVEVKGDIVTFELQEKELSAVQPLSTVGYSPRYEINIDPKSGLPLKIVQYLSDRKDRITTSFSNYDLKPKAAPWASSPG